TGRFVALHGWGANAEDLASLAPYLTLNNYEFLFPDAPFPHPQVPGGRMWYDLSDLTQRIGLEDSRQHLTNWLQSLETETHLPLSQTVLAGFSQGGAMTLDVGSYLPVAGLIVLSGYLHPATVRPLPAHFPPILMVHGRQDPVVPLAAAQHARDTLTQAGATVDYHEFDMGHEIQPQVLTLIRDFVHGLKPNSQK
ncbi:MAG: dienelactone hydrolase family protein, partial [Thermosynechococcaceae cyanobacterium]